MSVSRNDDDDVPVNEAIDLQWGSPMSYVFLSSCYDVGGLAFLFCVVCTHTCVECPMDMGFFIPPVLGLLFPVAALFPTSWYTLIYSLGPKEQWPSPSTP